LATPENPRVSILLPTHNRPEVLGFAIQSVLWQTETSFELLIVGDGCGDDTRAIVASFKDPRIRWFDLSKAPLSGYANRNVALRQARGHYVAYAQDDDIILPDHVEKLIATIETHAVEWAYSRPLWVTPDGFVLPYAINLTNGDELEHFLNVENFIPSTCVVHTKSALERAGFWPENVQRVADWRCWQRMILAGANIGVGYCRTPTTLHFRARWRDDASERRLRQIATGSWWPKACFVPIPAGMVEQQVFFEKLAAPRSEWIEPMRAAVTDISDRLAWAWSVPATQTWRHDSEIALNNLQRLLDVREDERREHERRWNSRSQLLRQLMRATLRKLQRR
jgi:hypothetical protein